MVVHEHMSPSIGFGSLVSDPAKPHGFWKEELSPEPDADVHARPQDPKNRLRTHNTKGMWHTIIALLSPFLTLVHPPPLGELFPGEPHRPESRIIQLDHDVSYRLFRMYQDRIGHVWLLVALELSGHGVPAVVGPVLGLAGAWEMTEQNYMLLANFFMGIITDLLWSVALKPVVRRVRPYWNTQHQIATVDKIDQYSFPSGHSARTVFEAAFLYKLASDGVIPKWAGGCAVAWATTVCASRIALGRHFVGDVVAGALVGLCNYRLVRTLWLTPETFVHARNIAANLVAAISSVRRLMEKTRIYGVDSVLLLMYLTLMHQPILHVFSLGRAFRCCGHPIFTSTPELHIPRL